MLAANLPVCQYAGMPGQSNSTSNNNNNSVPNNNINCINNNSKNNGSSCNNSVVTNPTINNNGGNGNNAIGLVGGGTSAAAAKNQLEQLNTMREALFSQDGWGCQHVNQDTNWEVPSSPEPTNKDPSGGPPLWKPTINNGTDLWESNLRNGGQPPTQPVQKTPWGHTPSSNLGGTWGEDDDGADSSSVWTGTSSNPSAPGVGGVGTSGVGAGGPNNAPQWGQGAVGVGVVSGGNAVAAAASNITGVVSGGATSSAGVNVSGGGGGGGAAGGAAGNGWGDPRELRSGPMGGSIDMRNVDPRDPMRAASAGDPRDLRMLDPRDPIRGDPRGISGRLNGTSEMWGQHHQIAHNQIPAMNKMVGAGGATNVSAAVVAGGGVGGIGPAGGTINSAGGVGGSVASQWGSAQTVVGPKDITSMAGKQVTGWEEPSPPPQRRNITNYDDGTSLWGQSQSRVPGGGSHWKDISDPMNRSHLIRNTIGTQNAPNSGAVSGLGNGSGAGLVGGQTGGIGAPGSVGVTGNPNNQIGVGPQGRLGSAVGPGVGVGGQHKPDTAMWVHPSSAGVTSRNASSWGDDGNHNVSAGAGSNWVDDKTNPGIGQIGANVGGTNSWNDSPASWNKNQNKMPTSSAGWGATGANESTDLSSDWATHTGIAGKTQPKLGGVNVGVGGLNTEMIKQSKQYRLLVDNGFKKDDVERALISANMNIEEAAEMIRANAIDNWRRHDETLGSYADHANPTTGGFPGRYPAASTQPAMSFPPNNHLLNNMGNSAVGSSVNNTNLAALNSMQPIQVQKYLNQGPHSVGGPQSVNTPSVAFGQGANVTAAAVNAASNTNNQPSAQQLRMLVQQIQLAVHSGYLSSQILNQPLAPTTLLLLNQLLGNIKHLQGAQQSLSRGNNANSLQINVAIAKYKQQIQNLQNQINAQQANYIKQQQQQQQNLQQTPQQHPATHVSNSNNEYLRGQHDAISALQGNFSEINLNKSGGYQAAPNQQSRLNQWKLPVLEKDIASDSTDFSRAPGTTKQSLSANNANNMGPLGLQNDGTWSTGRNVGDGWPDPSNDNENKDWSVAQPTPATAYTDLVQEFEPGKPWKGSQIKSIEDDPSITPGSVARSPLSINPTPKDADIFANAGKNSPTDLPPLSLSSSTWSFNPSSSNQNFQSWSDNPQQCATSELWATPMNKTSRGPPPGLGSNKSSVAVAGVASLSSVVSGNSNGWLVGGGRAGSGTNATWSGNNPNWSSNWLLLKNLNPQIDGSTLRTLCMQHGPLINFHLYLNQGIALCRYATREEASKAQNTLNSCVFGNTTICAESPSENEVQSLLQHLPQSSNQVGTPGGSSNNGGNSGSNGSGGGSGGISINGGSGNIGNSAGNVSNNGSNGNGNISGNSVANGAGNAGSNNASNGTSNAGNGIVNAQVQAGNGSCNSVSGNSGNSNTNTGGNNGTGGNANNANASGGNNTWRQAQSQQNQSRPSGRETDFDYISKFVCSIVDD